MKNKNSVIQTGNRTHRVATYVTEDTYDWLKEAAKREAEPEPLENAFMWLILFVCAPWLLVVVKNFGRDGWEFDQWDKWRLHWIPLTYFLYFPLGLLLFPQSEFVLYLVFPVLLAVGIAGLISMTVPVLWVALFLGLYLAIVFTVHTYVRKFRVRRRRLEDKKKVELEGA